MGFLGPEDTVFSQLKVDRDARSNVKAQNYSTSIEKVRYTRTEASQAGSIG